MERRTHARSDAAGLLLFSILFVISIGVANGESDQSVYLLDGLHRADPGFLSRDWFTTQTRHSNYVFGLIVAGMARAGLLETGLAAMAVLQSLTLALATFFAVRLLYERPLLPWAVAIMLFAAIGTRGIGLSRLVNPHMQASAIAGVALFCAIVLHASRRNLAAGIAFGIAGGFHAHFAILALPVIAFLAAFGRNGGTGDRLKLLLPYLILSATHLVEAVRYALRPESHLTSQIALERFPHHLDPQTWSKVSVLLFLALLVAASIAATFRRPKRNTSLRAAYAAILLTVLLSLAVGYTHVLLAVNMAFPWRLSTFLVLAALVLIAAAVCMPESLPGGVWPATAAALVALTAMVVVSGDLIPGRVWIAALAAILVGPVISLASRRVNGDWPVAASKWLPHVIVTAGFIPGIVHGLSLSHLSIRPDDPSRSQLYEWIRTSTPESAVFAIPPSWKDFRLNARRAIVVDYKGMPLNSRPDMLEWAVRMHALAGLVANNTVDSLDAGFAALDCGRARRLGEAYGVKFVIVEAHRAMQCGKTVYSDDLHGVVELESQ